ncbi:DUF308 domain-containing protein [Candidatus Saccharibacteria bacterium]|nr:DUF308 domain-containing protein [Candidatus Saccharibacteria bacterium]
MRDFTSKINNFLNAAINTTILMVAIGIFLALFPTLSLEITRWIFIIALVSAGLNMITSDLTGKKRGGLISGTILGSFNLLLGLIILINPGILSIIPIAIGFYIVISSLTKLRMTLALKEISNSAFTASILMNIISVVSGIIIIFQPIASTAVAVMLLGAMLIVYGISDLINIIILKAHVQEFSKKMKSAKKYLTDDIQEAEVIDQKKK